MWLKSAQFGSSKIRIWKVVHKYTRRCVLGVGRRGNNPLPSLFRGSLPRFGTKRKQELNSQPSQHWRFSLFKAADLPAKSPLCPPCTARQSSGHMLFASGAEPAAMSLPARSQHSSSCLNGYRQCSRSPGIVVYPVPLNFQFSRAPRAYWVF